MDKKRFWIDYSTSVLVEAKTKEEALEKFWNDEIECFVSYSTIEIDCVEEEGGY